MANEAMKTLYFILIIFLWRHQSRSKLLMSFVTWYLKARSSSLCDHDWWLLKPFVSSICGCALWLQKAIYDLQRTTAPSLVRFSYDIEFATEWRHHVTWRIRDAVSLSDLWRFSFPRKRIISTSVTTGEMASFCGDFYSARIHSRHQTIEIFVDQYTLSPLRPSSRAINRVAIDYVT